MLLISPVKNSARRSVSIRSSAWWPSATLVYPSRSATPYRIPRRSREQIAHSIGVPAEAVQKWENEESTISCPAALEQILRQTESAFERSARPEQRG